MKQICFLSLLTVSKRNGRNNLQACNVFELLLHFDSGTHFGRFLIECSSIDDDSQRKVATSQW